MKSLIEMNATLEAKFKEYILEKTASYSFTHNSKFEVDTKDFVDAYTKDIPNPKISITPVALLKMQNIVANFDKEIAWHGTVFFEDGVYIIKDIIMYPQRVTSVTVEADEESYGNWIYENRTLINNIRMQGHSHVNMGVSPSGTDLNYYKDLLVHVEDFYIFLILNKSGAVHVRFYDMQNNVLFTEIPILIYHDNEHIDFKVWAKQLSDKYILAPKVTPPSVRQTSFDLEAKEREEAEYDRIYDNAYYQRKAQERAKEKEKEFPYNQVFRGGQRY